jgi:hypothetical protein
LEDYLKRLDEGDVEDSATGGGARTKNLAEKIAALSEKRGRYQAMVAQLDQTGEDQISMTDPDSRAMAAHTTIGVGYNIQVAVDGKNKLIVEPAVTNQVVDLGLLTQTAEPAARSWASRRSTSSPIAVTSKSRISRLARRSAAFPTFPSRSAARRCARACFARTSSDTTLGSKPTSARPGSC